MKKGAQDAAERLVDGFERVRSGVGEQISEWSRQAGDTARGWVSLEHEVVRNPSNSNHDGRLGPDDIADVNGDGRHDLSDVRAFRADPAHRARVESAEGRLSDGQRAQYDAVAEAVRTDPRAALALDRLLIDDRLGATAADGRDLLEILSDGASAPDRRAWLPDLVQELQDPVTMTQGSMNTCGGTTVALLLAMEAPAEYARLAVGLRKDGAVETRSGDALVLDDRVDAVHRRLPAANRPSLGALSVIEAMMELGLPSSEYDPARDGHEHLGGLFTSPGLIPGELATAYRSVFDRPAQATNGFASFDELIESVERGEPSPAMVAYKDGTLHWVVVTGVEDGQVRFTNPWGREETAERDAFRGRLVGTVLPGGGERGSEP